LLLLLLFAAALKALLWLAVKVSPRIKASRAQSSRERATFMKNYQHERRTPAHTHTRTQAHPHVPCKMWEPLKWIQRDRRHFKGTGKGNVKTWPEDNKRINYARKARAIYLHTHTHTHTRTHTDNIYNTQTRHHPPNICDHTRVALESPCWLK